MNTYQIMDEPRGSKLSKVTVDPMWPLLGFMLGGALFSWTWSVINSFALNSPSRNKELITVFIALFIFTLMYLGFGTLYSKGYLDGINTQYIKMVIISVELIFCYKIFLMQRDSFDVYEYFNGQVAHPVIGLLIAFVVGRKVESFVIGALLAEVMQ
ncbi:hypothetical protein [Rheinheimera oceanensis]|uniref:hypothetical protein n=1 Tax=Rheinheimera oceanensis TaxID=2817449 RepID=UPI001BFD7BE6|nr:hypothetical protein [Rheinheimera oceanensis]